MRPYRDRRNAVVGLLLLAGTLAACAPTYVIVPDRREGYTARDTLRGRLKDRDVRVTFRHDTTWRVDTVTRWRTIYRDGARVDTVVVVDTVRVGPGGRRPGSRVDTVRVVVHDTARVESGGRGRPSTPGDPVVMPRPPVDARVDTVTIRVRDTVRIIVRDTIRRVDTVLVRTGGVDTVRIPGRRTLFVPPGQYPPAGQCRIWIYDRPPGQQARPAPCIALGPIPAGAFILFKDEAWDADYDWAADPDAARVPPEIMALRRRRGR